MSLSASAGDNTLKQNADFLKLNLSKAITPGMLTILSANINVFVDGILVGNKIGVHALAAINLTLPIHLLMFVVGSFFVSGTAINAAKALGSWNADKANCLFSTAVISTFVMSVAITVLGLLFNNPIASLLCPSPQTLPYVTTYLAITFIGAIPRVMIYVPLWFLRLDGRNVNVMTMMGIMSVGNIILDYILIYLLNMGVFGAGLASVLSTLTAFALGVYYLSGKDTTFTFKRRIVTSRDDWHAICIAGIPSALNNLLSTIRILLINNIFFMLGESSLVALFSAINGLAGFGECITLGIPQAASSMMGIYSGERDNASLTFLVKLQWLSGLKYSCLFFVIMMPLAPLLPRVYGLDAGFGVPLFMMTLAVFPGLWCSILSTYYNLTGHSNWSNVIIVSRTVLMPALSLILSLYYGVQPFAFYLLSEVFTLALWVAGVFIYQRLHPQYSGFLLMDRSLELTGQVLNFSVDSTPESICDASERISGFCGDNGIPPKQTMIIQLALEEIMTFIRTVNLNRGHALQGFDLRAYAVSGVIGIRMRYGGDSFNPFHRDPDMDDDMCMGVDMINNLVEDVIYQRTFGVNTLQILIREA